MMRACAGQSATRERTTKSGSQAARRNGNPERMVEEKCTRGDSNSHGLPHTHLKRARLPFRHECREGQDKRCREFVTEIQPNAGRRRSLAVGSIRRARGAISALTFPHLPFLVFQPFHVERVPRAAV